MKIVYAVYFPYTVPKGKLVWQSERKTSWYKVLKPPYPLYETQSYVYRINLGLHVEKQKRKENKKTRTYSTLELSKTYYTLLNVLNVAHKSLVYAMKGVYKSVLNNFCIWTLAYSGMCHSSANQKASNLNSKAMSKPRACQITEFLEHLLLLIAR